MDVFIGTQCTYLVDSVACRYRDNGETAAGVPHSSTEASSTSGREEAGGLRGRTPGENGTSAAPSAIVLNTDRVKKSAKNALKH